MNIERKTITVTLGVEGDDKPAVLVFERMKSNKSQKLRKVIDAFPKRKEDGTLEDFDISKLDVLDEYHDLILDSCISVSDLFFDGEEVTLEDIKGRNLYAETINQIVTAYYGVITVQNTPSEAELKNEGQQQDSSND